MEKKTYYPANLVSKKGGIRKKDKDFGEEKEHIWPMMKMNDG